MKRLLVAMVVVSLGVVLGQGAEGSDVSAEVCSVCRDRGMMTCPTCKGQRSITVACWNCDRSGHEPCRHCVLGGAGGKDRRIDRIRNKLSKKKRRLGRLPCPNRSCEGGSMRWQSGDRNPCKVCRGGGTIKCVVCTEGKAPCRACAGKRKRTMPCWDCAARGAIPCPGCKVVTPPKDCPWCKGKEVRACKLCAVKRGHSRLPCASCAGTGKLACGTCSGGRRVTCQSCGGAGKVRVKVIYSGGSTSKGGIRRCKNCKGRGYESCDTCKKGRVTCGTCAGLKERAPSCPTGGKVLCSCIARGSYAPLEALGLVLLDAGKAMEARVFFEVARELAGAKSRPIRGMAVGLQNDRERERLRAQRRLTGRIKKARAKESGSRVP